MQSPFLGPNTIYMSFYKSPSSDILKIVLLVMF